MADDFKLPPGTALPVSFTVTADQEPYVTRYLASRALPGERPAVTIHRLLIDDALIKRGALLQDDTRGTVEQAEQDRQTEDVKIRSDQNDEHARLRPSAAAPGPTP